jgi:anti-sigma B factor antagonist
MALNVIRRQQEGISILQLTGRLIFGPEDSLVNDEIRHALAARRIRLVVDLEGVEKIDSAGWGTLLYARAELRRAGGGLALANLQPAHMKALLMTKLETVFDIFGSDMDAVSSFFPDRTVTHSDLLELVTSLRQTHAPQMRRAS